LADMLADTTCRLLVKMYASKVMIQRDLAAKRAEAAELQADITKHTNKCKRENRIR
jgi:cell division protein FtsB